MSFEIYISPSHIVPCTRNNILCSLHAIYLFYCSTPAGYINTCYYYFVDLIWKGWSDIMLYAVEYCNMTTTLGINLSINEHFSYFLYGEKAIHISEYIKCSYSIKFLSDTVYCCVWDTWKKMSLKKPFSHTLPQWMYKARLLHWANFGN